MKRTGFKRKSFEDFKKTWAEEIQKKIKKISSPNKFNNQFLVIAPGVSSLFMAQKINKDILKKGFTAPDDMEVVYYNTPKKQKGFQLRRTPLAKKGKSATTKIKDEIQALLRKFVIARDGGCILRDRKDCGGCGWNDKDGNIILQAEHLVTRGASNYFGDTRNVICLCIHHHTIFKPQFSFRYWNAVEQVIGKERWAWFKRAEADNRPYKVDFKIIKLELEHKLQMYE